MIEIIKHGNRPITDKRVRFKCGRCGCEWIADNLEYTPYTAGMGHKWVCCRCPECGYVDSQDISGQGDGE